MDELEQLRKAEALHFAAQDGDLDEVRRLVESGYDVNAFDTISHTPLMYAAREEHFEVVRFLLSSGADVNAYEEARIGNTVLREIADSCSYEMAQILLV